MKFLRVSRQKNRRFFLRRAFLPLVTFRESIEVLHDKKQKLNCIFEQYDLCFHLKTKCSESAVNEREATTTAEI